MKKIYLFAFLDDHFHLVLHAQFYLSEGLDHRVLEGFLSEPSRSSRIREALEKPWNIHPLSQQGIGPVYTHELFKMKEDAVAGKPGQADDGDPSATGFPPQIK